MSEEELQELMVTIFLGYKYRKSHDILYSKDAEVPKSLIRLYYSDKVERLNPRIINRGFVERYIKNESAVENVHEKGEIKGLEVMYEDMNNIPFQEFELYSIMSLHRDLYSKCPYPEAGGRIRTRDAYLPGTGIELCNYSYVIDRLFALEDITNDLKKYATYLKETKDYSNIFDFIEKCVKLKCKLIEIHPFDDGNGRTVRCFINKFFEEAGIPPVYIKLNEKNEYNDALEKAIIEGDYNDINGFYLYKICDSIIELDINKRVQIERGEKNYYIKKKTKSNKK